MTPREQQLEDENCELRTRLVAREAQNRRDATARDDAEEATRVYRRALYRVLCDKDGLEVELERARMELAALRGD